MMAATDATRRSTQVPVWVLVSAVFLVILALGAVGYLVGKGDAPTKSDAARAPWQRSGPLNGRLGLDRSRGAAPVGFPTG